MPPKPWWKKVEPTGQLQIGRGGQADSIVLIALVVALAMVAAKVVVVPEQWERLSYHLPGLWVALQAFLHGEDPERRNLVPQGVPTPSLPTPMVMPGPPLQDL